MCICVCDTEKKMSICCDNAAVKTWGRGYIHSVLTLNSFNDELLIPNGNKTQKLHVKVY